MAPDMSVIAKLTLQEKYDWVEALMASIDEEERNEPIPAWHMEILRQRLERFRANPNEGRPWQEVMAELEAELDK